MEGEFVKIRQIKNNNDAYENLANAVVLAKVEDYRRALKRLAMKPEDKSAKAQVDSLERYFKSARYSRYTSVDGEYLIRKLREENGL